MNKSLVCKELDGPVLSKAQELLANWEGKGRMGLPWFVRMRPWRVKAHTHLGEVHGFLWSLLLQGFRVLLLLPPNSVKGKIWPQKSVTGSELQN